MHPHGRAETASRDLFKQIVAVATAAEGSGFDSFWVGDHFYAQQTNDWTQPRLEAYGLLSAIGARTQRLKLGTHVTAVTHRNPALLAKIVTTLDIISQGRAILGLGAAWHVEEHESYGFSFPGVSERLDRLSEAVQICRLMFDDGEASFAGKYYSIAHAFNYPRPVQERIPILIGGSGERRTLRLVAQYGDACNLAGTAETLRHKLGVLERHANETGRDSTKIVKTTTKMVVIDDTSAGARRAAEVARMNIGLSEEDFAGFALVGNAGEVREQAESILAVGMDGVVCTVPDPFDTESVTAVGNTLSGLGG